MAFNLREVFKALADADVEYVVVGGLAVILHGYLRATADLDVVIRLAPDNCRRALAALAGIGFRPRLPVAIEDFADPAKRAEWIEHQNMLKFQLWDPGNALRSLDVFMKEPIGFEALRRDAQIEDVDGLAVPVASIEHLIQLKQAAGRPRDRDDIAKLRQIREEGARYGQA